LLDRLTKVTVNNSIFLGQHRQFLPGVQIMVAHNRGYLLGVGFVGTEARLLLALACLGAAAIAAALWMLGRLRGDAPPGSAKGLSIHRSVWLPIGLLLGAAAGNLGEAASVGSVTDFIHISGTRLAFNLADVAAAVGGLILLAMVQAIHPKIKAHARLPESPDALA
jgi:lipoprotein signal peptidase